jgi:hypothetical protein
MEVDDADKEAVDGIEGDVYINYVTSEPLLRTVIIRAECDFFTFLGGW